MGKIMDSGNILELMRGPDGYLYLVRPKKADLDQGLNCLIAETRLSVLQESQNTGVRAWYFVDLHTLVVIAENYSRGDYELRREGPDGVRYPWKPRKDDLYKLLEQQKKGR